MHGLGLLSVVRSIEEKQCCWRASGSPELWSGFRASMARTYARTVGVSVLVEAALWITAARAVEFAMGALSERATATETDPTGSSSASSTMVKRWRDLRVPLVATTHFMRLAFVQA